MASVVAMTHRPQLTQVALETTDVRGLAEFYRHFLGLSYRPGDEPPTDDSPDDSDWLVLLTEGGERCLAFQQVETLTPTTWPSPEVPMQMHLDMTVADRYSLEAAREHALSLGARLVLDRSDDEEEPLYVLADPAGHPFCVFIS